MPLCRLLFRVPGRPPHTRDRKHLLVDIVAVAVCGLVCGCDGPAAVRRWAANRSDWLKELLELPNGTPSRDCMRNLLLALRPEAFQECFRDWAANAIATDDGCPLCLVAIDGKVPRRRRVHGLPAAGAARVRRADRPPRARQGFGHFDARPRPRGREGAARSPGRHPRVDIDLVGIDGHPATGFASGGAVPQKPYNEFFKAAVASAGDHGDWPETYHGLREAAVEGNNTLPRY